MKALYYEFFHIPEQGKIRDKVLMTRVVAAAVLIILCMLSMSLSAYAFYTVELTTRSTMEGAYFTAELEIQDEFGDTVECEQKNGVYEVALEPGEYTVQLTCKGTAETGFCELELDGQQYHTQQFFGQKLSSEEQVFDLTLYESAELTVIPHWGTSSCYEDFCENGDSESYLINRESIEIGEPPEEEMEEEDEETDPLEEEAEVTETEETEENQEEMVEEDPLNEIDVTQESEETDPLL